MKKKISRIIISLSLLTIILAPTAASINAAQQPIIYKPLIHGEGS